MPRQSGFTLIEILVAISMIAIIAAILSTAAIAIQSKSKETVCLSNQRQLGQAFAMYATDYDEHFPSAMIANYTWAYSLDPYVKNYEIYQCPSADVIRGTKGLATLPNGQPIPAYVTYIYNIHVGGTTFSRRIRHPDLSSVNRTLSFIQNPSRTVMLTDGSTTAAENTPPAKWQPKPYTPSMSVLLADAYYSGVVSPQTSTPGAPRALHGDRSIVTFCDGHSRSMHIQDFYNSPETVEVKGTMAGYSPCLDPTVGCQK